MLAVVLATSLHSGPHANRIIGILLCPERNALFWRDILEIRWLEDLICVAEKGHFVRAAKARHVTQSSLSRRIKSLETWVGTELLDRSHHPIRLTPAGDEFIVKAREIVRQSYLARTNASEYEGTTETSVITIACIDTLGLVYLSLIHI